MRNFSLLALGALFATTGVMAVPVPVPALKFVTITETETVFKIVGATSTTWVDPPKATAVTTTTTEAKEITTTTTTKEEKTTQPTSTTTSTTTTEEEKKVEPTSTTTPISIPTPPPAAIIKITTQRVEPTTTSTPVVIPTPTPIPAPPPAPAPQPGGWTGEATYYATGLGSCGVVNNDSEFIVAISRIVMDPQTPNGNPNLNPLCGKKAICTRNGENPTVVTVTDTCPECAAGDMDLSPAAFHALGGTIAEGRFKIECSWA